MTFRQQNYLRFMLMLTSVLTSFAINLAASAQDAAAAPLFVVTQDTVSAWDGTTFHHLIEGGLILSDDLSPDGRTLAVWRDPKNNYNSGDIWLVDVASLSAERIYTIDPGFLGGAPLWNAESSGILWSEYREDTGARAVEYVVGTRQITVHDVELPLIHEEGEFTVPGIAWWHDEQFALFVRGHYRNRVLRAYDFSGEILSDTPIENINQILGYDPWIIEPIIVDETPMLALYYGEHGVWDLIDPATGTVTPVEGSVAFGPRGVHATYLIGYSINPVRSEPSFLRYSETQRYELLDISPVGGVVLSPDGLAYAYVSADGHDIGIVRDGETSIVSLPETLTSSRRLRLVWSPMSGVLLPDLPPIAMPHKQTAVPGDCTGHDGIRPGATAHVNSSSPYDATTYLYGPPPRVEGRTLPAGFDFPVLRALCSLDDEREPAHMFEVEFGGKALWIDPNALSLTACADGLPTRLRSGDGRTERYAHLRSEVDPVPLLSGADETAETLGTVSAGDRLRLITAHCGTDGRTWWFIEAPDAVEGFVPETLGGEYILESADDILNIQILHADSEGVDAADGLYARINGELIRLDVQGFVNQAEYHEDGRYAAFTAVGVSRLYGFDYATGEIRLLVDGEAGRLEGDMAFSLDGSLVLFTAFSENIGATVWRVPVSGEGTPQIVVSGLPFWGDAGEVILPTFVETTNDTFTIKTVVISWEVEGGVNVGTFRTYTMDGELVREVPKPERE